MDEMAVGIIWIAVGVALVLLIQEQAQKLTGFAQMQERQREQVAEDIREICRDDECVALYQRVAASVPDKLVYYALAETRQRMAEDGRSMPTSAMFVEAMGRVAGEHGCQLELQATG